MRLRIMLHLLLAAAALSASAGTPKTCPALPSLANTARDASGALAACLARLPAGATVAIKPGRYAIATPLTIGKPVSIVSASPAACRSPTSGCIVLALGRMATVLPPNTMPITVSADGVSLDRVLVIGTGSTGADFCAGAKRPAGGGIRVDGSRFTFTNGGVRDVSCYTAMEVTRTAKSPRIERSTFASNGDHRPGERWSDGLTVHDTANAVIRDNRFFDNTDVQLIFGGCIRCVVTGNVFRHSGMVAGGSFAELMIHAWPNTSGNYAGSTFAGNRIDCGPSRRCGYGIMIGGVPWYPSRASGGTVADNVVRNAEMGLNVDSLTGPMTIGPNEILTSGGTYTSDCGRRAWPAFNVSPASRPFVRGPLAARAAASLSTAHCLLNRTPG